MKLNITSSLLMISSSAAIFGTATFAQANAATLHTGYTIKDVLIEKAMPSSNTSQGMAINGKYAYVARQRAGHNSAMYIERVNVDTGSVKDLGNRDIGHGNSLTYLNGQLFVVRNGGNHKGGAAVNIYNVGSGSNTLTYKRNIGQIKTDKGRSINVTGMSWDSKHKRMIYAVGNSLFVAVSSNPYESVVHQVSGHMTDTARYNWAKTSSGASQSIAVDAGRGLIYYVKSYNLNPKGTTNIGNTSYIGSVSLDNAVKKNKITGGWLDANLSYRSSAARFEAESVAVRGSQIFFNTNNMYNRNNRSTHTDFIAWLR